MSAMGRRYSHGERRYQKHVVDYSTLVIRTNFYMTRFLDTIACLTGYPQDMCVATATHGPQACTLSLCVCSLHRDKVVKRPYFCRANNRNLVLRGTAAVHLAQTFSFFEVLNSTLRRDQRTINIALPSFRHF